MSVASLLGVQKPIEELVDKWSPVADDITTKVIPQVCTLVGILIEIANTVKENLKPDSK